MSIASLSAQVTTEGTDFWFGYMDNDNASAIEIYISARQDANVVIDAPLAGFNQTISVAPNETQLVNVPINLMPVSEGKHRMGIHVTSDTDVTVYTLNKRQFSADAAVILPTNVLGQEYYVMAHVELGADRDPAALESEMLVVATEDDTQIEVTLSAATHGGQAAGSVHNITLNAGETYQYKSEGDLSGTLVRNVSAVAGDVNSCKKIAVFGGNKFTNVGGCGGNRDHLLEQMFPVNTWGKDFLFVPYETRSGGDYLKIIAAEDNTNVTITGISTISFPLDKGELYINKALIGVNKIVSDRPIQVAQLSRSTQCDGVNSDPFMIMLSPLAQRVKQVTFDAFNVQQIDQYYLTLITGAGEAQGIILDGTDVSLEFTDFQNAAYANIRIGRGTHTLTAENGVIAYVYGYGQSESFGYSAGVSLENLNLQIEGEDEQIGILVEQGCVNSDVMFDVLFDTPLGEDPRYDTFLWDFGDGTTGEGKELMHSYNEPGTYEILLTASKGEGVCSSFELITREVEITEIEFGELLGPVSVCPNVSGVIYSIDGSLDNSYSWEVSGGTIVGSSTGLSMAVDWGPTKDDAWVKLLVKNELGCAADTLQLDVKINRRLEPVLPKGAVEVCFLDLNSSEYFTPETPGSEYEWFVTNGSFVGDNDQSSVIVQWDGVGTGEIWYREHNPTITNCEGFSEKLAVTFLPEIISQETITSVRCNGESNGEISLAISGGKGTDYTVSWSNGASGLSIDGLPIGTYTATITDEAGCEVLKEYIVEEPEVLEVNGLTVLDVRCFEESNGEVTLEVIGGTAPYTYNFTGNGIDRTSNNATTGGFSTGDYSVEVVDANGCIISTDFFVGEPPLLEADLNTLINIPICPQASDGTIFLDAMGGTPAYQFFWNTTPAQEGMEVTGLSRGIYTVTIIDANGCEATLDVEVNERFPRVHIPTAFSPNGDGENDEFLAVTDCNLNYNMQVFNKWGSIIFSTTNISNGWDGTFEGKAVQDGVYTFKVFYSGSLNGVPFEETIHGSTRVFR